MDYPTADIHSLVYKERMFALKITPVQVETYQTSDNHTFESKSAALAHERIVELLNQEKTFLGYYTLRRERQDGIHVIKKEAYITCKSQEEALVALNQLSFYPAVYKSINITQFDQGIDLLPNAFRGFALIREASYKEAKRSTKEHVYTGDPTEHRVNRYAHFYSADKYIQKRIKGGDTRENH